MNSTFLNFILAVVIVITAAKLGGYLSIRLGQPSVLGELLAGILLGPTVLNLLHLPVFADDPLVGELLAIMAEVGVVLLMFLAGLELELSELLKSGRVASLSGTLGVVVPLALGALTAVAFGTPWVEALFIGLALSATSVSISAQTLMEMGVLRSKVGLGLLGAAVFDDVLVILLLSTATILVGVDGGSGGGLAVLTTVGLMVLFLAAAIAIGFWVIPRLVPIVENLPISQNMVVFALLTALIFGWAAEVIGGVAAITGAFLAGLFFARTHAVREIEHGIAALAYSFFVPIFFVNIGLESNLRAISGSDWIFALVLAVVAVLTKIVGSGAGAMLGGFNRQDALRVGIGMVSRGEVGLIVASVALAQGFLEPSTFSILVFIVIVATVITPPLLRLSYGQQSAPASSAGGEA